jgi:hypothetical protein
MPHIFNPPAWTDYFDRSQVFSTTAGPMGWAIKDTSSAGTPTYLTQSGRGAVLTCDNTSEAQIVTLYQKDILPFTLGELHSMEFVAKVSGIDAVTTLVMGLASAQNDTSDTVTTNAWFRMEGSASTSNVVVETDDNVTNTDDVATGVTLSTTYKKFRIDFTQGYTSPRFFIDGARVAGSSTALTLAGAASTVAVQPYFQLQKGSGTGIPAVTIGMVSIKSRYSY